MCITVPGEVLEIAEHIAQVETMGVRRCVLVTVDGVQRGDWVLVYSGLAVARVEPEEAQEILRLLGGAVGGAVTEING